MIWLLVWPSIAFSWYPFKPYVLTEVTLISLHLHTETRFFQNVVISITLGLAVQRITTSVWVQVQLHQVQVQQSCQPKIQLSAVSNDVYFVSINEHVLTLHLILLVYYSKDNVETCVRDCQQDLWVPPPLYNTLQECCNVHHYWIEGEGSYSQCMGFSPTLNPTNLVSLCLWYLLEAVVPISSHFLFISTAINECTTLYHFIPFHQL